MTEKDLINSFRQLKRIKPRRDWVLLNKTKILGEERKTEIFPFFRPVYAGLFSLLLLMGLFEFSQQALPGEYLYYLKKAAERGEMILSPVEERPTLNLKLVNRRLEELDKIVKENEVKKLAPALKEYQASVSEATRNLVRAMTTTSDPLFIKGIVEQTQKLEESKEKLTKVYGIAGLEEDEQPNPTQVVVELLIKDLEERTLSEEDGLLLEEAKKDHQEGNLSDALIKILDLTQ